IRRRIAIIFVAAVFFLVLLSVRLSYLQIVQETLHPPLTLKQRLRPVPLLAQRGVIYDRNMNTLAASMSFEAAYAIPVEVRDPEETARRLAPILNRPVEEIEARLRRQRAVEWLKLRLTPEEADAIRRLDLPGIGIQERPLRYYPNGSLAAQVIGFAGIDNQGLEGLERQFESYLKGQDG